MFYFNPYIKIHYSFESKIIRIDSPAAGLAGYPSNSPMKIIRDFNSGIKMKKKIIWASF